MNNIFEKLSKFGKRSADIKNDFEHMLENKQEINHRAEAARISLLYGLAGTLWITEDLKRAIQDIYDHPLREYARETINRQLKTGINDEDLATLVVSLREDGKLSLISEDESVNKEPQIICSMGLRIK